MLWAVAILAVLLIAFAAFVASRPAEFRIQRSAEIDAPSQSIYAIINDFRRWGEWSPWDKLDPTMKRSLSGPEQGIGSVYEWDGNSKVGSGRMTITDSKPGELVAMLLEFIRPFKATNQVQLKLEPSGAGTRVSWIMDGKNNFMSKAMCLFMDMDRLVGADFEAGLGKLKQVAEAGGGQAS